jgi:hypothetical protein
VDITLDIDRYDFAMGASLRMADRSLGSRSELDPGGCYSAGLPEAMAIQLSDRLIPAAIMQPSTIGNRHHDKNFIGPRRVGHRHGDGIEMRK